MPLACRALVPARSRRGVTLIEIAIVVAIMGIIAAIAGTQLTKTLPSWRTRRAANQFASHISMCKQLAIAHNTRCRVRLSAYDADIDGSGDNTGAYFLEAETSSGGWDILPVDESGVDDQVGEGTVVITRDGEDELVGVSLEQWDPIAGVDGDDLVFDTRGWLDNPVGDFDALGYVNVTFVNKPARREGNADEWTVRVSRGGLVRLESSRSETVGNSSGTASTSTAGSGGGGYSP